LDGLVDNINDNIKNPSHYTQGKIEAKTFIVDQDMTWAVGNAVKYLVRYRWKHKGEGQIHDLRKSIENIQIEIDKLLALDRDGKV
jgi:hypothetical protein